jgi:hypothetical protein
MNRYLLQIICPVLIAACSFGCGSESPEAKPTVNAAPAKPQVNEPVAEPWISKPKTEWPQIVLTNHAEFNGHSSLHGASGFLIQTKKELVLAATAAHLVRSAGGVEPDIAVDQLTSKIKSWKMFPRTMPNDSIEITSLGVPGLDDENLDWLVLAIKQVDPLPAYPLRLRQDPVRVGETVFLIGCPYSEPDCKQNVYTGTITERAYGDRFRYDLDPTVDLRGFSGAPIIDKQGYVVGIMTVWFEPKMSGDNFLEGGGEDVATIYDWVQRAN